MVAPAVAASLISGGASLLGGLFGNKTAKKNQQLAKEQLEYDKMMGNRQIDISKYIEQYAKQAAGMNGATTDMYGGRTYLDPVTGEYKSDMGVVPRNIQTASDTEELDRIIADNAIRRQGLNDSEEMRRQSVTEAGTALGDIQNFKRGIGAVDAGQIGSQLRGDRTRAINAGYDDAERAAQTMQLRTGSSAVGDALTALARDRVRAQAEIGSPELEGLQLAEGINQGREQSLLGKYQMFGNEGRNFYDAAYNPSTRADQAYARIGDMQKFDISKLDLAMGGSGQAAGTIGNAAAGVRQGYGLTAPALARNPTADMFAGIAANSRQIADLFAKKGA